MSNLALTLPYPLVLLARGRRVHASLRASHVARRSAAKTHDPGDPGSRVIVETMNAVPTLTNHERAMVSSALGALGVEDRSAPMRSGSDLTGAPRRQLALYAPAGTPTCLTVQIHADLEEAAAALAEPYRLCRVPRHLWSNLVGYVIDVESRTIRAVSLTDDDPAPSPPVDGLSWGDPVRPTLVPETAIVRLEGDEAKAAAQALEAFGAPGIPIYPGAPLPQGMTPLPSLGKPTLAIMGSPGDVRRVEYYDDLGAALMITTAANLFGLIPQGGERQLESGYLLTLPALRVYPLGQDLDESLDLEDLVGPGAP